MQHFVNDNFKIDIFLDTNILVDYVLDTNPVLTHSINYLNNKRSVRLRSSHYVEFELAEVLKVCFFGDIVYGHYPDKKEKSQIKLHNWSINGIDYSRHMQVISTKVTDSMSMLKSTFSQLFDDHVLHEDLITPTCDLLLQSIVSREDSLVTVSSVYPRKGVPLEPVALLSNDSQFCSAINRNKTIVNSVMTPSGLKSPIIMDAKQLTCKSVKTHFNISKCTYDNQDIEKFWNKKILELVKQKNEDAYIGTTYKYGKAGTISGECIYFRLQNTSVLNNSNSILFFTNNAEETISLQLHSKEGDITFWNNGQTVNLPNDNPNDVRYSFKPIEGKLDTDELEKLREPDNLVFYLNE